MISVNVLQPSLPQILPIPVEVIRDPSDGGFSREELSSSAFPPPPPPPSELPPLPPEWKEAFDPRTGQKYYYNIKTYDTSWDRPRAGEITLAQDGEQMNSSAGISAGISDGAPSTVQSSEFVNCEGHEHTEKKEIGENASFGLIEDNDDYRMKTNEDIEVKASGNSTSSRSLPDSPKVHQENDSHSVKRSWRGPFRQRLFRFGRGDQTEKDDFNLRTPRSTDSSNTPTNTTPLPDDDKSNIINGSTVEGKEETRVQNEPQTSNEGETGEAALTETTSKFDDSTDNEEEIAQEHAHPTSTSRKNERDSDDHPGKKTSWWRPFRVVGDGKKIASIENKDPIGENDKSSNSLPSTSGSNYGKKQQEHGVHTERKTWWRPFKSDGDHSDGKKIKSTKKKVNLMEQVSTVELIKKVPIFDVLEDYVLEAIYERLSLKRYKKSSEVLQKEEPVKYMLFIVRGKLECRADDGSMLRLKKGDFCGEELLSWCIDRAGFSSLKEIDHHRRHPLSSRTIQCLTRVVAFCLDFEALEYITTHFKVAFRSPLVQGAVRYFSLDWRSLAARHIQTVWRSSSKRRISAGKVHQEDGTKHKSNELTCEDQESGNFTLDRDIEQEISSSAMQEARMTEPSKFENRVGRESTRSMEKSIGDKGDEVSTPQTKAPSEGLSGTANSAPPSVADDRVKNEGHLIIQFDGMPQRFTYKQLKTATGAFSDESIVGQGGFGRVYRGVLPSSGIQVAVKKMDRFAQNQGVKEFTAEVSIINKLRHRNLIQLLGWCDDVVKKKYLLVYELMPNGSLEEALFTSQAEQGTASLSWTQRFHILTGTAAALEYLHTGCNQQIIHRDIKCSNIMLDKDWNAKLGDFGLARLVDHHRAAATTYVAGTMGYIAPEVISEGRFTEKADVFGFGVVALEVACGRRVYPAYPDKMGVMDWVWRGLSERNLLSTVDKRLSNVYDDYWMEVVLMVGLLCTHPDPHARPSMRRVVQILAGDVPVPSIPASKPTAIFSSVGPQISINDLQNRKGQANSGSGSTVSTASAYATPSNSSRDSTSSLGITS